MDPKLFNYYSIDECIDEDKLYHELDKFVDNGSLEYKLEDRHVIKISDLDLTEDEVEKVSKILDGLDVFPYLDRISDEDNDEGFYESDYGEEEY
jgi:hypothetical protein